MGLTTTDHNTPLAQSIHFKTTNSMKHAYLAEQVKQSTELGPVAAPTAPVRRTRIMYNEVIQFANSANALHKQVMELQSHTASTFKLVRSMLESARPAVYLTDSEPGVDALAPSAVGLKPSGLERDRSQEMAPAPASSKSPTAVATEMLASDITPGAPIMASGAANHPIPAPITSEQPSAMQTSQVDPLDGLRTGHHTEVLPAGAIKPVPKLETASVEAPIQSVTPAAAIKPVPKLEVARSVDAPIKSVTPKIGGEHTITQTALTTTSTDITPAVTEHHNPAGTVGNARASMRLEVMYNMLAEELRHDVLQPISNWLLSVNTFTAKLPILVEREREMTKYHEKVNSSAVKAERYRQKEEGGAHSWWNERNLSKYFKKNQGRQLKLTAAMGAYDQLESEMHAELAVIVKESYKFHDYVQRMSAIFAKAWAEAVPVIATPRLEQQGSGVPLSPAQQTV
eukprot:jgi/Chlat1/1677/Chrsp127S01918